MIHQKPNTAGANSRTSKLTEEQAQAILDSEESAASLAKRNGVGVGLVYQIRSGKRWKHLKRTEK